jgi:glucose-6-phosphate isomerase
MTMLCVWLMMITLFTHRAPSPQSNGKRINRHGVEIDYPVGEVDFGEPGTNSQHSFFQMIHQGQTVPVDFLGFVRSQHDLLMDNEKLSSHDELMANFFAQPDALANGKTADEVRAEGCPEELVLHKVFDGNRPSSSLLFPELSAYVTGQILSLYEHRTAVQGFIWDLNSFDQWGVELGKKLALDVKEHLMEARNSEVGDHEIIADNPATSRIMNYYIENSRDAVGVGGLSNPGTSATSVTRKTHKDHFPPQINDLGGHSGRLS